ncbi:MAG: hypothetical protein QOG25_2998, partial [Acetobacteraceae bacterium]|nr:hypothetical protein [Acetobacteraceae bacterium]
MGAIADCLEHGLPKEIAVPLLPVTESFGGKGNGKAPALYNPATGRWEGFDKWELGDHDANTILRNADVAGGNCGVILGAPAGSYQFLAYDVDLLPGPLSVKFRNGILTLTQQIWNQPLLVRETWPYRALCLINLPVDADGGSKTVFHLKYADPKVAGSTPEPAGKIELLAHGQQAAIAGTHESGNKMVWFQQTSSGPGNQQYPAPPLHLGVPKFETFEDAVLAVVAVLEVMADHGFTYTTHSATASTGPAPAIVDLAAPSAADIAGLLDQTPNPETVDRDIYASFMLAISGARTGLKAVKGALSQDEEDEIANAVARWASRWTAPKGSTAGTFDEERAKWCSDFGQPKDEHFAGWRHVLQHAQSFGAPDSALLDLAMTNAQNQFTADPNPPPAVLAQDVPGEIILTRQQMELRRAVNPSLVMTADMAVSERMLPFFSGNAVYVPHLGNWMVWDGLAGWKTDDVTTQ